MKLADHVEHIRQLIDKAFRNRLGRMGISASAIQEISPIPVEYVEDRKRIESIRDVFIAETGTIADAYEKLIEEFTFTLFNRLAALKVMEAHTLHPEIVTRRSQYGDRSFAHFLWLEENPGSRNEEQEDLVRFMEFQLDTLASDIPLFSTGYPYHLLPTVIELNGIMKAFNQVETDPQVEPEIWKSDDVLGWLYESYNNYKKAAHKESGAKTEFNKVSIQSQVYTPRWVVKFLVDNSLGKLYLEMYPDSSIKETYKIANAPKIQTRDRKPLTEIHLIDPATGSGNFLLYGFDLFYDLYTDQIDNYGADYDERNIPELIILNNLYGVDLDDRAVQMAQLGLYIKAKRKKRFVRIEYFNIVSSDFFLPDYKDIKHFFENGEPLVPELEKVVIDQWTDIQQAHKFGSLIRIDEKFNAHLHMLESQYNRLQIDLFESNEMEVYSNFRQSFFESLQKALAYNTEKQGLTFLNTKTRDAITFLQLLTQKYDVAVTNPPYTDSSDFGPELKCFVDANYKKPHKFHINLYATFINRCYEFIDDKGKIALIHPLTFMYIKTFEDVRKFIIDKLHIVLVVDYGLSNYLFGGVAVNPAFYILEKETNNIPTIFIKLNDLYEGKRYDALFEAYDDLLYNRPNKHNYSIDQSKLKVIEGCPYVYWISDGFREKFKGSLAKNIISNCQGLATTNNNKYLRLWWEISETFDNSSKKWFLYAKGGPYNKWFGNLWCVVNFEDEGYEIKEEVKLRYPYLKGKTEFVVKNENFYFKEGITYSASGSKGASYRFLPKGSIFDVGGSAIFASNKFENLNYILSLFNSTLVRYILGCLNPTVNTQAGDIERIPFVIPSKELEESISTLGSQNIEIKKDLNTFRTVETNFEKSSLTTFSEASLRDRLIAFLEYENAQYTVALINEAIINQLIFEIYSLSLEDRWQVENKMGKPVGELPLLEEAKQAYLSEIPIEVKMVREFIQNLSTSATFEEQQIQIVKAEFLLLYQSNNDLEEFCTRHQLNPINVWYWFRESKILPQGRAADIALEFLVDALRTILMEDEDGIIPLIGLPGEPRLLDRIEQHCFNQGFTSAQFMQMDGLLDISINEYIEHFFFKNFSEYLNLFRHLPSTPFIWHLSSGTQQGFEAYIIIYKWNRDSLYKLKTKYLSKRAESLGYRQIQLSESSTAQAQSEKEIIRLQLQEIKVFTGKIDELIAEGYDPKLDDGVGKNIAPLQKKGLLRCDVLNSKQLEKYLKADW